MAGLVITSVQICTSSV